MAKFQKRKQLIIGPSGSGKTTLLLLEFYNLLTTNKNPIFIVPTLEHATRIKFLLFDVYKINDSFSIPNDYLISKAPHPNGFFDLEDRILTFDKYARKTSQPKHKTTTEMLKTLLIQTILEKNSLKYFSEVKNLSGFRRGLSELLAEFKRNLILPTDLSNAIEKIKKKISYRQYQKLEEILLVYQQYQKLIETKNLIDDQDLILKALNKTATNKYPYVYIDGFFEFTPAQEKLIDNFCKQSTVKISLCAKKEGPAYQIPEAIKKAYEYLETLAFEKIYLPNNLRTEEPSLILLNQKFLSKKKDNSFISESCNNQSTPNTPIIIQKTSSIYEQIREIAKEIKRLCFNKKYNFSDIALIFRKIGNNNRALISHVFSQYDLPVNIHEGQPLINNPLIQFILNALVLLTGKAAINNLKNFCNSAYLNLTLDEAITIKKLIKNNWAGDLTIFKSFPALEYLHKIGKKLQTSENASHFNKILESLIEYYLNNYFTNKLEANTDPFLLSKYKEDQSAYKKLLSLISEMEVLDQEIFQGKINFIEYVALLKQALKDSLFTVNKLNSNQVQVYDYQLMHQKEYQVVFICEFHDHSYPKLLTENYLIKDHERDLLQKLGNINLDTKLSKTAREDFLFYIAITRAKDSLYLCLSEYNNKAQKITPSPYLDKIKEIIPENLLKEETYYSSKSNINGIFDKKTLRQFFIEYFNEKATIKTPQKLDHFQNKSEDIIFYELYQYLLKEEKKILYSLWEKTFWKKEEKKLEEPITNLLKKEKNAYHISSLEKFAVCPYNYFCSQILKIEPEKPAISPKEKGIILHEAINIIYSKTLLKQKDLSQLATWQKSNLLSDLITKLLKKYSSLDNNSYAFYSCKKELEEIINSFLEAEINYQKQTGFFPARFEETIEFILPKAPISSIDQLKYQDKHQTSNKDFIFLKGRIDRLDTWQNKSLIIDYKTGKSSDLKIKDIENGLHLQLPSYAIAILSKDTQEIIGLEVYSLRKSKRTGFYISDPSIDNIYYPKKKKNVLPHDEFKKLLLRTSSFIQKYAEQIERSCIAAIPHDFKCPSYCPYSLLCRINKWDLTKKRLKQKKPT